MATNLFENVVNPISGEIFKCISITPDAYTMHWIVKPKGYVPFEHVHLYQDEIFEVKEGELKLIIDGIEHIVRKGEAVTVPKGRRHLALNNSEETMEAVVHYTPALDYERLSQCFCGLMNDGYLDKKGAINIPMMGYFLKKMKCKAMARPTNIPATAFNIALNVFYIMGAMRGWNKLYRKYTT